MIATRLLIGPATALSLAISGVGLNFAWAEATIIGTPEDVKIVANHAQVEELFSGLREKFEFSYRGRLPIDQTFDGTYEGPLRRVVRQLLKNYDYVLKSEDGKLIIDVIDQKKISAQPNSSSPPPIQRTAAGARNDLADGQGARKPLVQDPTSNDARQTNLLLSSNPSGGRSSALITIMESQATSANRPNPVAATPGSPAAPASTMPSQAEMAEVFQRANSNLQALNSALSRLSPPPAAVSPASPAPAAAAVSPPAATPASTAPSAR